MRSLLYFLYYTVIDPISYIEDQSRDRCESLYVDHGQSVWKVTLARAHEEQPEHNKRKLRRITQHTVQSAAFYTGHMKRVNDNYKISTADFLAVLLKSVRVCVCVCACSTWMQL